MENETDSAYKADILVVDDTRDNLRLLSKLLMERGYYVRPVSDGKRAITAIRDQLPDLILLDIMMPGMDGYAVCEVLKADERTRDIPVIFISALNETVDKVNAFSTGGVDFITKPFHDKEVLARVDTHLRLRTMQKRLDAQNIRLRQEIAERERTENALRKANADKDMFFSIIAHDLRSPFTALLGLTKFALRGLDGADMEKTRTYFTQIRTSAESVYALLENLLSWSRLQRGVMAYHPETFSLSGMAGHVLRIFTPTADEKGIRLRNHIPAGVSVYADQNMIHTVFRNLVSNALKFTDTRGSVGLSARRDAETVEITVSDTGVGIPEDAISKLFRIEAKLTTPGTAGEQGTGLGLTLCSDLVQKNGGTMAVESEIGQGSVFRVSLPFGRFPGMPPSADACSDAVAHAIDALPESLRAELRGAAKKLDIEGVNAVVDRICERDAVFDDVLRPLAENYQYIEILALIQAPGEGEKT